MKFLKWLRQVFCVHDFEVEDGQNMFCLPGGQPWFRCRKCGKREWGV